MLQICLFFLPPSRIVNNGEHGPPPPPSRVPSELECLAAVNNFLIPLLRHALFETGLNKTISGSVDSLNDYCLNNYDFPDPND